MSLKLNSVMTAAELYNTTEDTSTYPIAEGDCEDYGILCYDDAGTSKLCSDNQFNGEEQTYIEALPADPTTSNYYGCTISGGNYTITADLEGGGTFTCSNGSCYE